MRLNRSMSLPLCGVGALIALLVGACGSSSGQSTDSSGLTTVKVGILPVIGTAPVYLGMEKGFFADEGLKVEPTSGQGGAALLPSMIQGGVPIIFSNTVSLMQAQEKGLPVSIISSSNLTVKPGTDLAKWIPQSTLMVAANSDIRSAKALNGKTVAVNSLGNVSELLARNSIDRSGGNSSTVKFIELGFPEMPTALAKGRADAIVVSEPFTTVARDAKARVLLSPYTELDEPASDVAVYATTKQYAEENPDVIKRFVSALTRASEYAQEHPDEVRSQLTKSTKMDEGVVSRVGMPYFSTEVSRTSLDEISRTAVKYGFLKKPSSITDLVSALAPDDGRGR